jgi:hypothetical protein
MKTKPTVTPVSWKSNSTQRETVSTEATTYDSTKHPLNRQEDSSFELETWEEIEWLRMLVESLQEERIYHLEQQQILEQELHCVRQELEQMNQEIQKMFEI